MINYTFKDSNGKTYKRIEKRQAKKAFYNNKKLVICANNLQPFSPYGTGLTFVKTPNISNFERFVNNFEYYNCINSETGRYSSFYICID